MRACRGGEGHAGREGRHLPLLAPSGPRWPQPYLSPPRDAGPVFARLVIFARVAWRGEACRRVGPATSQPRAPHQLCQ